VYKEELGEDEQVQFKGNAKAFVRTYAFLSSVLPYNNAEWEKRSIFLNFLIHKIPAPKEDYLSKGILESIDMDSYRIEKRSVMSIILSDEYGEIDPVPTLGGYYFRLNLPKRGGIIARLNLLR
jgi:type I restriction enzyme, R subunit